MLDLIEDDPLTTQDAVESHHNGATCRIETLSDVAGVQSVRQSGDCTVCTSVLAPTTLLFASSESSALLPVEVEALEAEQSTCVVALQSSDSALARALVQWLAPSASSSTDAPALLLVLQGDVDGAVRYYVTSRTTSAAQGSAHGTELPLTGTLVELREPIQWIVPFASSSSTTSRSRYGVLVVGVRGSGRLLLRRADLRGSPTDSASAAGADDDLELSFEAPVQSIAYIASLDCVVYCVRGVVHAFRLSDVLSQSQQPHTPVSLAQFASQLPLPTVRASISTYFHVEPSDVDDTNTAVDDCYQ